MPWQREFEKLFEESRLTQSGLAMLLGVSKMTAHRWFSTRPDAFGAPFYALQFLRLFLMLPEAARSRVLPAPKAAKTRAEPEMVAAGE